MNTIGFARREVARTPDGELHVVEAPPYGFGTVIEPQGAVSIDDLVLENEHVRVSSRPTGRSSASSSARAAERRWRRRGTGSSSTTTDLSTATRGTSTRSIWRHALIPRLTWDTRVRLRGVSPRGRLARSRCRGRSGRSGGQPIPAGRSRWHGTSTSPSATRIAPRAPLCGTRAHGLGRASGTSAGGGRGCIRRYGSCGTTSLYRSPRKPNVAALGVSRPLRTVGSRSSVGRSRASRPMIYAYVQMFAKLPGVWSNDPVTLGVAAYQWYLMSISSRSSSGSVVG